MTARHRHATGSASATLANSNGIGSSHDRLLPFSWQDWFLHASIQQRAAALGLANQQGVLYPHQLPAVTNGIKPIVVSTKETDVAIQLTNLLSGKSDNLPKTTLQPVSFFDTELDPLQQQAVIRAISTPDIFLLQGLPGTGKSRVLAEVILQSAVRGRRVLFLGAQASSVDVVLQRLVGRPEILALRLLDGTQRPETLPDWLRRLTPEEQTRAFREQVLTDARRKRDQSESACQLRRAAEPHWQDLQACLDNLLSKREQLQRLDDQAAKLAEQVDQDADRAQVDAPFGANMAEWRNGRDAALAEIDAQIVVLNGNLAAADQESQVLAQRIACLEPGYRAKKQGKFWSPAFWAHLFHGHIVPEMEALLGQRKDLDARRENLNRELTQAKARRQELLDRFTAERSALVSGETDARRRKLLSQREPLERDLRQHDEEWNTLCAKVHVVGIEKSPHAVAVARQTWQRDRQRDEEHCRFAHQWSDFVAETIADFATRLPSLVNLIAGTCQRWLQDVKFRDAVARPFDLTIIEDANCVTQDDLIQLARGSQRCILVAHTFYETSHDKNGDSSKTTPWQVLWRSQNGPAADVSCSWRHENSRLICDLVRFSPEDLQHLETERLADAPDIELGILQRPDSSPCLAQVSFGPERSFGDAFQFMMREVQEFPVSPLGRTRWWTEDAGQIQRCFGVAGLPVDWSVIEPGVRLGTVDDGTLIRVSAIAFAKAEGWNRTKAEAWLDRYQPGYDAERTAFLEMPHRFPPALATIIQSLLSVADRPSRAGHFQDGMRQFEFIAVPALAKKVWPSEGAGLELDLSAPRTADRLPVGLRQGLPPRGFVNYIEAQALVRRLETFSQKEVNGQPYRVVATALYESQVELLRRLVAQSEILRNSRLDVQIDLPRRLHQRECDVVFLSLTRSPDQRAAAFGENENELPLALTRARTRLLLFADPGALSRRVQSNGPAEHHNGVDASLELSCLTRLLAFLQARQAAPNPTAAQGNGKG